MRGVVVVDTGPSRLGGKQECLCYLLAQHAALLQGREWLKRNQSFI
jgi:hypothetical protein